MSTPADLKLAAATRALELVTPGMKLGLGTGSTMTPFIALLGEKVKAGLDVTCVPTSEATAAQARALGIKLTTLEDEPILDLTIDGADEIDPQVRLIKGGGGALLREKIVAVASDQFVVIADASKRVANLGAFPVPVEIVRFGLGSTMGIMLALTSDIGCAGPITLRRGRDGELFVTDGGNVIVDCAFGPLQDPHMLDDVLRQIPGVVETGLFLGICDKAFIASESGVEVIEAASLLDELDDEDNSP